MSTRSRVRIVVLLALLIVAAIAIVTWREPLWATFGNQQLIQERVTAFGPWGPLATVALNALQVVLAPVPGYVIGLANGYLFGVWLGTVYSLLGLLIGSAIAMALGRVFGRPLVERLVRPDMLCKWDRIASRRGPAFFFLIFLVPGLPDDIVAFTVGLSTLPIPKMVVLGLLGRLPGVVVSSWIGANMVDLPLWAWIPLIGGVAGLAWLFVRYGDEVEGSLVRAIRRLAPRRRPGEADGALAPEEDPQAPD
jgi:uncharacterized membrane protein YdjX (TVP38/TMEM64 family)